MGQYIIAFSSEAKKHFQLWKKVGNPVMLRKIDRILNDLVITPHTGVGNPELLKHNFSGYWSRRIDDKNRIVYKIDEENTIVFIASAMGHYNDK